MNRRPPLRRSLALVAVAVPLALAACGRVPGQFEILNDQVPSIAMGGCTVAVNPTLYQGDGRLDLAIVRSDADAAYFFYPLIENNLPAGTGTQDPNQIQLSGFNVDITAASNAPAATQSVLAGNPLAKFQFPWSGGIPSGGSQLTATVNAFPVALASELLTMGGIGVGESAQVQLHIQAIGTTTTGTEMQSDPFTFPLEVCVGCLIANVEPCPYAKAPANPGNACNPAQDDFVDCCTDNGALICPPTVAATQ